MVLTILGIITIPVNLPASKGKETVEIYYYKSSKSFMGLLTVIVKRNGQVIEKESLRDIPARSGQPKHYNTKNVLGKSPIPDGNFFLWTHKEFIKQYSDLDATGKEVARFYPISSSRDQNIYIKRSETNPVTRSYIGLHDENDFPGTAGCIAIIDNKHFRLIAEILTKHEGKTIPLHVRTLD